MGVERAMLRLKRGYTKSSGFASRFDMVRKRLGRAGFTILELFIVVEIIGFLATIVMSNYYRSKKAAEVAVVLQNVKNVQIALTSYYAMENKYPVSLNPIWLDFYHGKVVEDLDYCGGGGACQGNWNFFVSNDPDIRFGGPGPDQYAVKSKKELIPYARYIYADVATSAKIIH